MRKTSELRYLHQIVDQLHDHRLNVDEPQRAEVKLQEGVVARKTLLHRYRCDNKANRKQKQHQQEHRNTSAGWNDSYLKSNSGSRLPEREDNAARPATSLYVGSEGSAN